MARRTQFGNPANYNASPATRSDGDSSALEVDATGSLKTVSSGSGITSTQVQGGSVDGAAVTEAPVLTGGRYNTTPPTYSNGQKTTTQSDVSGNTKVTSGTSVSTTAPTTAFLMGLADSNGNLSVLRSGAATTDGSVLLSGLANSMFGFNGTGWDRTRSNTTGVVVAAATTTTQSNVALNTFNAAKLIIVVNITAGAGTVTVAIDGITSSTYRYNLLTSTALAGVGTTALRIFPGATASPNATSNDSLPRNVQITVTVVGSVTYGVDYVLSV